MDLTLIIVRHLVLPQQSISSPLNIVPIFSMISIASISVFLLVVYVTGSLISLSSAVDSWEGNPLLRKSTDRNIIAKLRVLTKRVRDRRCKLNLCFILQGDGFVSKPKWQAQKDFVKLLVSILTADQTGRFCAVQYARTTKRISILSEYKISFLKKVSNAGQIGGFQSDIAAALGTSSSELYARRKESNTIIILGNGLNSLNFFSRFLASRARRDGVTIYAIAIGRFSTKALLSITADSSRIYEIDSFFDLAGVVVGLVNDVCGFI